jgi:ribosome-associated protein
MDAAEGLYINRDVTIPLGELEFRFATSGGPGGQHANKTESQVTLRFNIEQSPSLSDEIRRRLLETLAARLDKRGVLQLSVQETRSQHQNRQLALVRLQLLLEEALRPSRPRRPTRPGRAAHERRLDAKKRRGRLKRERQLKAETK